MAGLRREIFAINMFLQTSQNIFGRKWKLFLNIWICGKIC